MWVPLSGAIAQQRNVDTIANNVANSNTPGFKKDQLVFKEYLTALENNSGDIDLPGKEFRPEDFYRSQGAEHAFVKVDGSYSSHEQGMLEPTGNPLDIGIRGDGFFEVLTPNGIRFTRRGTFSISSNGELVTDQGYKVLSKINLNQNQNKGGETTTIAVPPPEQRVIKLENGKININLTGDVSSGPTNVGTLSVVEFNDVHTLKKEGDSLYINEDNANIISEAKNSSIHQGFVESSNVNPVEEMSNLIKANRNFESIQKVIKTYDNISGRAVNEIGKF